MRFPDYQNAFGQKTGYWHVLLVEKQLSSACLKPQVAVEKINFLEWKYHVNELNRSIECQKLNIRLALGQNTGY
jgi:hypothetical protein